MKPETVRVLCIAQLMLLVILACLGVYAWFVYELIGKEATIYSSGYNEKTYQQLECNDTAQTVIHKLGFPFWIILESESGNRERILKEKELQLLSEQEILNLSEKSFSIWGYSKQGDSTANWQNKWIEFYRNGRLRRVGQEKVID